MTPWDTLRAAAARVRQGWCQNALDDGQGNVCALGAFEAIGATSWDGGVFALFEFIHKAGGVSIASWNNAPGRTAEEVATLMEFVALCEEQKAQQVQPAETVCAD